MSKKTIELMQIGEESPFPKDLDPMLATLVDEPFENENWLFEIKWDGYRAISYIKNGYVEISSRNNKSFNEKFYPVYDELKELKKDLVIDGEIIVVNEKGISDFGALQNWRSEADGILLYYVFDLLWYEGRSLMNEPLSKRREMLKMILPEGDRIKISEDIPAEGMAFFKSAEKIGLEGILAKKADSIYIPGNRSKNWLKIKTQLRQEVVVGGYTLNEGSSKLFSSLLVGVFDKNQLVYTGKVGTGFSVKKQNELMKLFKPLEIKNSPFHFIPDINKPSRFRPDPPKAEAVWLKPEVVCEVNYRELTSDGIMRHPSFKGLREDKTPKKVLLEKETETENILDTKNKKSLLQKPRNLAAKTFLNPSEKTQVRNINNHTIKFTNLDKLYWLKEKVSKRNMLNYYFNVAKYMLPYLENRPQSLNRFPNGINGKSFYQKNVSGKVPDWIEKFPYESEGIIKNFMLCNNEATLLYMANLGCIEFNPWSSTIQKPDHPDFCIIDLDPDKNTFDQVIEAAQVTRKILVAANIDCYCKTSGSTGIHIYIPLGKKYTYEESKEFGRVIATMVNHELPEFTSIERQIANRGGKLYVDFLQNRPNATVATVYSLRPKPGATVSMPIHWDELKKGLKMNDFTIHNSVKRIEENGDIFKGVLGKGINMKEALKNLSGV
jgi:bifunctional non-homologous end joining protein LigD